MALIYIVEDDENIREIETIALKTAITWSAHLKRQLHFIKTGGYYAGSGALDVMLPDESGYDIVRKLRKILRQRNCRSLW